MEPSTPITTQEQLQAALQKDFAAIVERDKIHRSVANDPLPGPSARAFAGEPLAKHGFTLRPVVGGDVIILKRLDSPLIRRTKELVEHKRQIELGEIDPETPPPPARYSDPELRELIFQFTHPFEAVERALAAGLAEFRAEMQHALADVPQILLPQLVDLVEQNYQLSFETFLAYKPRQEGKPQTLINVAGKSADGFGWWPEYYCQLRRHYSMSHRELIAELPLAQGFVLCAWAMENNGLFAVDRIGDGYVRQEVNQRLAEKAAVANVKDTAQNGTT